MYNKVSGEDLYIEKHEFFLDPSKEMVYEPPMWQVRLITSHPLRAQYSPS